MHEMLKKDQIELMLAKLHMKRNLKLKGFLINIILILLVWLLSMTPFYYYLMARFTMWSPAEMVMYLYFLIGIWKILSIVFFLVPGLSYAWELCWLRRMTGK